jgi:hypothetical protein
VASSFSPSIDTLTLAFTRIRLLPSTENYVEVTLQPLEASANQRGSKNIIIVQVPRSQIDTHRAEHLAQERALDELIAQALAEEHAPHISGRVICIGSAKLIESSRFLPERPLIIEGRSPDYDRDGFKGWIIQESIVASK